MKSEQGQAQGFPWVKAQCQNSAAEACLLNAITPWYTENKENYHCKELTACRSLLTCSTAHMSSVNTQSDLAWNYENNREEEAARLRKELADKEKEVF